jgi:tRNA(Ile)-lysidine synthase
MERRSKILDSQQKLVSKTRTKGAMSDAGFLLIINQLKDFLQPLLEITGKPNPRLRVAFSGGLDSCVLLDLLMEVKKLLSFEVEAFHVHHGLSPNANDWVQFCKKRAKRYGIAIEYRYVNVDRSSKLGIEGAAREVRYQALLDGDFDFLLLAHHQNDQAETLLLQLFRGAGLKGLSGMAPVDLKRKILRPLLNLTKEDFIAYAKRKKLLWIEDESNLDPSFDRNYCRLELIPSIKKRYPSIIKTLNRVAGHMNEANSLLEEMAVSDSVQVLEEGALKQTALIQLSQARASNLIRWWLNEAGIQMPSKDRLDEILKQILYAKNDAQIKITLGNYLIRRYQDKIYLEPRQTHPSFQLVWSGESEMELPDGSKIYFEERRGAGLSKALIANHVLMVRSRQGGERFKPQSKEPTRTLKYLLQRANIPPWERDHIPLIYLNEVLAYVPYVGYENSLIAQKNEEGVCIHWVND